MILLCYAMLHIVHPEDDVIEVIFNLHVQRPKFGKRLNKSKKKFELHGVFLVSKSGVYKKNITDINQHHLSLIGIPLKATLSAYFASKLPLIPGSKYLYTLEYI